MRRHGARKGSVRPAILLSWIGALLAALLVVTPATAGDRALIDFLGYSADGDHFAFEEYGIQDGSGFAYSIIYIVQLSSDSWVKGTPYRVQAPEDKPDMPLAQVRAEARQRAQADLDSLHIDNPAQILALIGDGAVEEDGTTLAFAEPACCGIATVSETTQTLRLENFPVAEAGFDCVALTGDKPLGYALALDKDGTVSELHRDGQKLPMSRGCPMGYRLFAVLQPFNQNAHRVAIVSTFPFGFEGPSRRFLAVPLGD